MKNSNDPLIPIQVKGKKGFISSSGSIIAAPKFADIGEFSEGMIAVREYGTFGYLDKNGNYAIKPQFDFASEFKEGLAIVYKNGAPFYINLKGEIPFIINYAQIGSFSNGRAIVKTASKKFGVINKNGELIIDTVFRRMEAFKNGLSIVEGLQFDDNEDEGYKNCYEIGVIDSLGNFIIPYYKYSYIEDWHEGFYNVTLINDGYEPLNLLIDHCGEVKLKETPQQYYSFYDPISCGLVSVIIPAIKKPGDPMFSYSREYYHGFMNLNGELIFNDKKIADANSFSENRCFVTYDYKNYFIVNNLGKHVGKDNYQDIQNDGFQNGIAILKFKNKWGIIDTNANWIVNPIYDYLENISQNSKYISFAIENKTNEVNKYLKWGLLNRSGKIVCDTFADHIYSYEDSKNYFICQINEDIIFLDEKFKVFWKQNILEQILDTTKLKFLNTVQKAWANCEAYSLPNESKSGGWAVSNNVPKLIDYSIPFCLKSNLCLTLEEDCTDTIDKSFWARSLYLINNSFEKIEFRAQDSRLYILLQAKTDKNEWKDIESFPKSFCGNSNHIIWLEPGYYWKFKVHCYEGDIKTRLRYRIEYIDPMDKSIYIWEKKIIVLYSNEFDGYVNPGQFWNKGYYGVQNFMDSYFE
ncbi:MAG: WG repeat-containing protein [Saprospiraceae bacterium]|nr:WG repeat-containing protein [Saprospiraceae bacterium]